MYIIITKCIYLYSYIVSSCNHSCDIILYLYIDDHNN